MNKEYTFIFTHEEEYLDKINSKVQDHPKVIEASQDYGNWYSNGETGPEWFSMHVRCLEKDVETVQTFIESELKKLGASISGIRYIRV